MRKRLSTFIIFIITATTAFAATRDAQLTNTSSYNYNYMYPYLNNKMRTNLNPGTTNSQSLNPINTVVKTQKISGERRVVARPKRTRSTTSTTQTNRAATQSATNIATNTPRRVVPRQNMARSASNNTHMSRTNNLQRNNAHAVRDENALQYPTNQYARAGEPINNRASSVRCMADYTECMNNYCKRKNTAYNRCYCSSKLAQIDYKYQSEIDALIKQILTIQGTNNWSDEEMNEYWMETVGKYSNENSWINLDNALNIDWASMESRVRGQTAFTTGHEYCIQHLRNCSYMLSNLRDAYKSEIGRDCAAYESSLIQLKNAAESIVSSYK